MDYSTERNNVDCYRPHKQRRLHLLYLYTYVDRIQKNARAVLNTAAATMLQRQSK